jgi:hypothetical protein
LLLIHRFGLTLTTLRSYVGYASHSFQMDLASKFHEEATCNLIPVDNLQVEVKNLIFRAERVNTRYGPSIVLTLRAPESRRYKVYLPRRYCALVTDDVITAINQNHAVLYLVYMGTCRSTSQHLLNIVQDDGM